MDQTLAREFDRRDLRLVFEARLYKALGFRRLVPREGFSIPAIEMLMDLPLEDAQRVARRAITVAVFERGLGCMIHERGLEEAIDLELGQ